MLYRRRNMRRYFFKKLQTLFLFGASQRMKGDGEIADRSCLSEIQRTNAEAMIRFSRDEAAARDAVSQAFTRALMNQTLLETMP